MSTGVKKASLHDYWLCKASFESELKHLIQIIFVVHEQKALHDAFYEHLKSLHKFIHFFTLLYQAPYNLKKKLPWKFVAVERVLKNLVLS